MFYAHYHGYTSLHLTLTGLQYISGAVQSANIYPIGKNMIKFSQ